MTYLIPDEELTNDGPYRLGPLRRLAGMEVAYTELILQLELQRGEAEVAEVLAQQASEAEDLGPHAQVLGMRARGRDQVSLPDAMPVPQAQTALAPAASLDSMGGEKKGS